MKKEYSAGVIVYKMETINNKQEAKFLLIKNTKGHWDFPKGIIEPGEETLEAALRETKEETCLDNIQIDPKFSHKYNYFYKDHDNNLVDKTVSFYLGELKSNEQVKISHEHNDYKWLSLKDAKEQVSFDNAKNMLDLAKLYLAKST